MKGVADVVGDVAAEIYGDIVGFYGVSLEYVFISPRTYRSQHIDYPRKSIHCLSHSRDTFFFASPKSIMEKNREIKKIDSYGERLHMNG